MSIRDGMCGRRMGDDKPASIPDPDELRASGPRSDPPQKSPDGQSQLGVGDIACDLGQRLQDKPTFVQSRVRDPQTLVLQNQIVE